MSRSLDFSWVWNMGDSLFRSGFFLPAIAGILFRPRAHRL